MEVYLKKRPSLSLKVWAIAFLILSNDWKNQLLVHCGPVFRQGTKHLFPLCFLAAIYSLLVHDNLFTASACPTRIKGWS